MRSAGLQLDCDPDPRRDELHGALHIEEIDRPAAAAPVACGARSDPGERHPATFPTRRVEDRAQLEQPCVFLTAPQVVGDRVDETGQQRGPQHGELLGEWVEDVDEIRCGGE